MRRIFVFILVTCAVLAAPVSAPAQGTGSMQFEHLHALAAGPGAVPGHSFETSGTCDPTGTSTMTFEASGIALGPYEGTFTETGTYTVGPGLNPFALDLTSFESEFTILAVNGATITGTKRLTPESGPLDPLGPPHGACFDEGTLYQTEFRTYVEWEATVSGGPYDGQHEEGVARVDGTDQQVDGTQTYGRFFESFVLANRAEDEDVPAVLELEPEAATNEVGTRHCVTATVRDDDGEPVQGVTVRFAVTGASDASGSAGTDADGQAEFCYDGPDFPGADAIDAYADTDGDASRDEGEPADSSTKVWVLPSSTTGCRVSDGGWIRTAEGDRANFGGNAHARAGTASGEQLYVDHGPAEPLVVKSIELIAVVCSADRRDATIYGRARVDGQGEQLFRITLHDGGEPSDPDTYGILLSGGYYSGERPLAGGNAQIR